MIDRTLDYIGKALSGAEKATEDTKNYFLAVLYAGITMAFLLVCSVGVIMALTKLFFL